ncbi:zinc finger MYM-type protein 1-like [Rhopalosiphum padi]|uniref:zinc finger MYM-type protein 1-like n=1 Tax=Rhopalosiphum padi TaxID=40932 RepID=UPI00298DA641|nr:zinc finger MYM-type protein 1-like [Rhopalosiphum padi]
MKRFLVPLSKSDESDESVTSKQIRKSSTTISVNDRDIQNNIFDISQNVENGPNQPNITFPRRNIGGKQRSFNVLWYSKYEWLEYSKIRDSIFCFYCRHFTSDNSGYRDKVLIVNGYSDWKHIGNMLEKHNSSNIHKLSLKKYKSWISAKKTGSVATKLNTQLKEDILKNREIMRSLIRCVLYCGRQDIVILKSIVEEIQNGSNFYSIIVDEAKTESNIEQMRICVRYISDNRINERFLGFLELKELHAKALADSIQLFLCSINLDIKNCIGQSYDGASAMSGTINGVQQYIREMSKNPCLYVHCYAHRLNLVLVDASKHVSAIHNTIGILEAIYSFQSCSSLRNSLFLESPEDSDKKLKIPQHCETRWVSKYKGIHFFKIRFKSVIKALKECTLSKKAKEAAKARGLLNQFATFDNLLIIFCLDELLFCINSLSVYLQTKSTDLSNCITLIECTKDQIKSMRTENKFHDLYEKVIKSVEEISGEMSIPVTKKRKKNVSSKRTDYFVTSSIGQNQMDNISEHEIKMRSQYFEIIDNIVVEMNRRFKQTELIEAVEACNPSSKMFLDFDTLIKLPGISTDNQFIEKLRAQCDLGKKNLEEVYRRILVIPISSATAERSFSTMRRIKTYNRSTMTGKRLHNLALLSIEREKSEELIQNPDEILNEFAILSSSAVTSSPAVHLSPMVPSSSPVSSLPAKSIYDEFADLQIKRCTEWWCPVHSKFELLVKSVKPTSYEDELLIKRAKSRFVYWSKGDTVRCCTLDRKHQTPPNKYVFPSFWPTVMPSDMDKLSNSFSKL